MSIINTINDLNVLKHGKPVTLEQIDKAQNDLNVIFADDYKEYLLTFGVISACGIELTGVSSVDRLSVVNVTQRERERISNFPKDAYVIENLAIESIIIFQNQSGNIYSISETGKQEWICSSLAEYIHQANS